MRTWERNEPYDLAADLIHSDPQRAVALFVEALRIQPERPRIHANMALALSNLGRHDGAATSARRAVALEPTDPYVASRLVSVLFEARDYEAVLEAVRRARQLEGMSERERYDIDWASCWTLMHTSPGAAVDESAKFAADGPDDPTTLATYGSALAAVCRFDDGIEYLERAIALDPSDPQYEDRRDQIIQSRDEAQTAMDTARRAVETDASNPDRWRELGIVLAMFARLEESLAAFEHARVLCPLEDGVEPAAHVVDALMIEATVRPMLLTGDLVPVIPRVARSARARARKKKPAKKKSSKKKPSKKK